MPGQEIFDPPDTGDQSKHEVREYIDMLNQRVEDLARRHTQENEEELNKLQKENGELLELVEIVKGNHSAALRSCQMYKLELANIARVAEKREIDAEEFRVWAKSRTSYLLNNASLQRIDERLHDGSAE